MGSIQKGYSSLKTGREKKKKKTNPNPNPNKAKNFFVFLRTKKGGEVGETSAVLTGYLMVPEGSLSGDNNKISP